MKAANPGHTNPELASMRIYTGIEEIANSLSSSSNPAVTNGSLNLNIDTIFTTPGQIAYTQTDRFVDVGVEATKTVTTAGTPGYAIGTGFDNTFAQNNDKNKPASKKKK